MVGTRGAFEDTTLSSLGMKLHLGHGGGPCPIPAHSSRQVHIVDTNGVHTFVVHFCMCKSAKPQGDLLFEHRLYPTPGVYPRVAFTFDLLKHFTTIQVETACSAWSYFDALAQITDAVNTKDVPVGCDSLRRHLLS